MDLKRWTNYYSGGHVEKNEIGVAFSKYGEMRDAYRFLVRKHEGKRHLGRTRRRWEDNSKMELQDIRWGKGGTWTI